MRSNSIWIQLIARDDDLSGLGLGLAPTELFLLRNTVSSFPLLRAVCKRCIFAWRSLLGKHSSFSKVTIYEMPVNLVEVSSMHHF